MNVNINSVLKKEIKFTLPSLYTFRYKPYKLSIIDKKVLDKIRHTVNPILLTGYPKSGNTWVRFVIFNYFNILNNNADITLTFKQLNKTQVHTLTDGFDKPFEEGYPIFYRCHDSYRRVFDFFDKIIYVWRNPLDTLISYYYYSKNRINPFQHFPIYRHKQLQDINTFVKYTIDSWIYFHKNTVGRCNIVLKYEEMMKHPFNVFKDMFSDIGFDVDVDILKRSILLSDFRNIRKMEDVHGCAGFNGEKSRLTGSFVRSGKTNQYKYELKTETIDKINKKIMGLMG